MIPDVVVAGGGPAGLTAAIAARLSGLDVVVVEPHAGVIDKACGEGVMPAGVALLSELGVRVRGMPFRGVCFVHGDVVADGTFPRGHGLGVRRLALHEALRDRAADLGVHWQHGAVRALGDVRARFVVAADGLHSRIRSLLGLELAPRRVPRYGMRRHFRIAPWTDRVEVHFAPGVEAYVTPVAEDVVGVAFLFEPPGRFGDLLARFPVLAERVARAEPASTLRGAGPFEQRVRRRVEGNVLLVGDAAGYLDPLTGEGVALGMRSAVEAIGAIARGDPESYERRWREITRRHFLVTQSLLAVAERPWIHAAFVRSARALPGVFDAVLGGLGGDVVVDVIDREGSAPASPGTLRGLPST